MSEPQAESALDFVMDRIGLTFTATGECRFDDRTIAAARAELAALRSAVSAAYLAGQLAMRERCAKVCDERASQCAAAVNNSIDFDMEARYHARHETACHLAGALRALSPEEHRT